METLILTCQEIEELIDIGSLKDDMKAGMAAYSKSAPRDGKRLVLDIRNGNTATVLGPGISPGIPAYSIKVNSKFPSAVPALKGIIALFDSGTGDLLALLDSSSVTAIRTGLTAALATATVANPDARRISIIGAGKQNTLQFTCLLKWRKFEKARIYDIDPSKSEIFRKTFKDIVPCETAGSLAECVSGAEVILVATWSRKPLLDSSMVQAGCHITSLGADEKGKVELSADLVRGSRFYCDDTDLNMLMGTPGNLGLPADCIHAEIGKVFAGQESPEGNDQKTTIYSSVGLPVQDLLTAWHVYRKAIDRGTFRRVHLY